MNVTKRLLVFALVLSGFTLIVLGCTQRKKEVHVAIWTSYLPKDVAQDFESKTGIKIVPFAFNSNEELLAKMQASGNSLGGGKGDASGVGFDVAFPSDYMVFAMKSLGLLEKLDRSKLGPARRLDPVLEKMGLSYDPKQEYSVPFDWGTTGIGVRTDLYKGSIKGWSDILGVPALSAHFSLLDDAREVFSIGWKLQGMSLNPKGPKEEVAKALSQSSSRIKPHRKAIRAFTSETKQSLVDGSIWVAHAFSVDALQAERDTGGKVKYVVPSEGATLWVDNLVIPRGAKNLENAYAFIKYFTDPKTMVKLIQEIRAAPAYKDVRDQLPEEVLKNEGWLPRNLKGLEMMEDLGEGASEIERAWTELKIEH